MHETLWKFKEDLNKEIHVHNSEICEQIIQHEQRVFEVGEQCFTLQHYAKKKFTQLEETHVKTLTHDRDIEDLKETVSTLEKRIEELQKEAKDDQHHMTKIMPLQIASMLFDVLKKNFTPRHRPKLNENFKPLISLLGGFADSGDKVIPKFGNINFARLDFTVPTINLNEDYVATDHPHQSENEKGKKKLKAKKVDEHPPKGIHPHPIPHHAPEVKAPQPLVASHNSHSKPVAHLH